MAFVSVGGISKAGAFLRPSAGRSPLDSQTGEGAKPSLEAISRYVGGLRFRRSPWGADDRDVMAKIHRIDAMYRELLRTQEDAYKALLEERDCQVRTLQRRLEKN